MDSLALRPEMCTCGCIFLPDMCNAPCTLMRESAPALSNEPSLEKMDDSSTPADAPLTRLIFTPPQRPARFTLPDTCTTPEPVAPLPNVRNEFSSPATLSDPASDSEVRFT